MTSLFENELIDGWLLYDFQKCNPIAHEYLKIPPSTLISRRFFYWIPKIGNPVKIMHRVEQHLLDHLEGETLLYSSHIELKSHLQKILDDVEHVAMEYFPNGALPYLSRVDGGTLDFVHSCGVTVVSSAPLLQKVTSILTRKQMQMHCFAADVLNAIVEEAVQLIHLNEGLSEYDVALYMQKKMLERHCVTNHLPIVAVGKNAANPHYVPSIDKALEIKKGDLVLLDLWCKQDKPDAVYADICRMTIKNDLPTEKQQKVFDIVKEAQLAALQLIQKCFKEKRPITGFEADLAARDVIEREGFGAYFTHRTGHNIYTEDHGNGTHLDSFETEDKRLLLPSTCFSIEPGIYLPNEFGIRLETDVLIDDEGIVHVTGGLQESFLSSSIT